VQNSSDVEDSTDSKNTPKSVSYGRRIATAVVIPKMAGESSRSNRGHTSTSTSPLTSLDSSTHDSPIEITPDTSVVNTPAPSVRGRHITGPKFTLGGSALNVSNKRTRSGVLKAKETIKTTGDEALARRLQEQEYAFDLTADTTVDESVEEIGARYVGKGKGKARAVSNSGWDGKGKGKAKVVSEAEVGVV
jgi:hypothetical protein